MVGFAFIVEGMSISPRPVLWRGIDFGGGGAVMVWGDVSQHHWPELVVIAGKTSCVVPFLQAHPAMTLQHENVTNHTARSV